VVPYIALKHSIDTDEDLLEMGVVLSAIFSKKTLDSDSILLLSKARDYIDRELRECLSELNTLSLAISDR
jgi:hypothetical protein